MRKTLIFLFATTLTVSAELVEFTEAGVLYCNGDKINIGSYAAPLAVDWDGDGKKDLICGQFDGGMIRFYPNVGTNDAPVFSSYDYLLDGLSPISVPYG